MEKIAFSDFNLELQDEVKKININGKDIEVKQYLPIEEQISVISTTLLNSADENNFANPIKLEVYFDIAVIEAYTNIEFNEKDKEQIDKTYDLLESNDIINKIFGAIPADQYEVLKQNTLDTIDAYYKHINSALGILEQVSADYKDMDFNADEIKNKLNNPNIELVKDIVEKLG